MANILIVDDQPYLGELLSEELAIEGHRVKCVEEAGKAVEEVRSRRPDIILLDLYLKGYEGWDLLHRFKVEDPALPVVIVTAYDNFADDPRLAKADGYVIKDIYTNKIKQKIEEVLMHRE